MAGGPVTHRGAAGDWYTVFGPTLDVSFNAGAESAVHRRPHVSFLQDGNTAGSEYNRRRYIHLFIHLPSILSALSPCRSCSGLCSTSPPPPSRRTDSLRSTGRLGSSPAESTACYTPLWNPGKEKDPQWQTIYCYESSLRINVRLFVLLRSWCLTSRPVPCRCRWCSCCV